MIIEEFKNKKNFNKIKKFLTERNINFKEVKLDSNNYLITSSKIKQEVFDDLNGVSINMPRCKYDVKITDFYFYDEQGTRLKILPEFLSSIFDEGVSKDEKNELVEMAIKQVKEISKKLAVNI